MKRDLTQGPITSTMLYFAFPMILGNLLQQFYNIADTLIVGRFLGGRCPGCSRLCLYPYDISYLYPSGTLYGKRGSFFHPLRTEG